MLYASSKLHFQPIYLRFPKNISTIEHIGCFTNIYIYIAGTINSTFYGGIGLSNNGGMTKYICNIHTVIDTYTYVWRFPKNGGTPKSSSFIGFSMINHLFLGAPIFQEHNPPFFFMDNGKSMKIHGFVRTKIYFHDGFSWLFQLVHPAILP